MKDAGLVFNGSSDDVFEHSKGEKTNSLPIEQALESSPLIKQAALVGDSRPYNLAIVQPDYDALHGKQWMEIEVALWAVLDAVNEGRLEGFEQLDQHAKILQENLIIVGPDEEGLPTDRKGALVRTELLMRFAYQIETRYSQKQRMNAALKHRRQCAEAIWKQTDGLRDIVKRTNHLELFLAFVEDRKAAEENGVTVDGAHLTIPRLVAVGQKIDITIRMSGEEAVRQGVDASVDYLKRLIDEGAHLYGISTGYGGSADTATRQFEAAQTGLIRHLNAGFGDPLPTDVARGAMLIRANSTIKGASALRWYVIEQIVKLLNKGITPLMPKRGSLTASGDLMPLSYLAALLMGKEVAKSMYRGKVISAQEALAIAEIEPIIFGPKEALALVNGTAAANALAAVVLYNTNILHVLAQAATALSVESILGTNQSFDSFIQEMKPHLTQIEVAKNLEGLLRGSKLARDEISGEEGVGVGHLRQDRYHQRTASQWLGPQLDVVLQANEAITIEMNAATDNPLIDVERGSVLHGGNYQGTAVAVPMDHVRLSLQALGKIVFEQYQELTNKFYSNGLPPNLAGSEDMGLDMGLKGADTLMAGYMAELSMVANPATNHVQPAELRNQSINSMALMSARYTAKAVKILQMMMAAYLYAAAQAVDLRNIERAYRSATEEAIRRAVKRTLSSAVENANELEAVVLKHLSKKVIHPFSYAFTSHTRYTPLFESLAGSIRDVLNGESEAVGNIEVTLSSNSKAVAGYAKQFMADLAKELDERLPEAKERALQRGAAHLLGNTRPVYEFVRRDLEVRFERNDHEAGPETQKIFDAIQDRRIVKPLLDAFFPAPPQEPVPATRQDLDLTTSN